MSQLKPLKTKHRDDELQKCVIDVTYLVQQIAAIYVWWGRIFPKLQDPMRDPTPENWLIYNAVLESWCLSIRSLNEFFNAEQKKDDDIMARHYGYYEKNFLEPDEAKDIHKRLAHLTTKRSDKTPWDKEFTPKSLAAAKRFLMHLESKVPHLIPPPPFSISSYIQTCEIDYNNLKWEDLSPLGSLRQYLEQVIRENHSNFLYCLSKQ
jgi:hypothetical protein